MRCTLLALALTLGCGDNTTGPAPMLDQVPLWTLPGGSCFGLGGPVAGDLDGDGIDDLVVPTPNCRILSVPNAAEAQLAVYRGTPTGYEPRPVIHLYPELSYSGPYNLQLGDLDGDGRADLMVSNYGISDLFLGTKSLGALFDNRRDGAGGAGVYLDVDGDGNDEFLATDGHTVTVLDWKSSALVARATFPGQALAQAGDVNGDGRDDVYVRTDDGIALYRGCKRSTCKDGAPEGPYPVPVTDLPISLGDVNGDHRADAVVLAPSQTLSLHLADADGVLRESAEWAVRPDLLYSAFRTVRPVGDVDGDGRPDLALSETGRTMILFSGASGPASQPTWEWSLGDARDPDFTYDEIVPVTHRDLDGDGFSDVVMLRTEDQQWNLVAYHGGKVPAGSTSLTLPSQQACKLREDATQPDITVDGELIARSLRLRTETFGADACELTEQCIGGPGLRKLLDFSVSIQNFGGAPAILPLPDHAPPGMYVYDSCHGHHHLQGFAEYKLLNADGTLRVAGHKQGFYPTDSGSYCDRNPASYVEGASTENLYISAGWADVYPGGLGCQWIDVTDVPDGSYLLRVKVNAKECVIIEDDVLPNEVEVPISIVGQRVTSIGEPTNPPGEPVLCTPRAP